MKSTISWTFSLSSIIVPRYFILVYMILFRHNAFAFDIKMQKTFITPRGNPGNTFKIRGAVYILMV